MNLKYLFLEVLFLIFSRSVYCDSQSEVISYDATAFSSMVPTKPHFIMFFAPWCGHCKNLYPTWNELASKHNKGNLIVIAKVDCTLHTPLCSSQEINGYPTLKLYTELLNEGIKYRGQRDFASLEKFIYEQLGVDYNAENVQQETKERVIEFTDKTFKQTKSGSHFVKFYAPWCGHCQRLAPIWDQLGEAIAATDSVTIGKVDCTQFGEICKEYEINRYPTLLWIVDGKKEEKYGGERTLESLKSFVASKIEIEKPIVMTQSDKQNDVITLNADNFQENIAAGLTFIKYFAPWCGHCKRLAPIYEQLGRRFSENGKVKIAQIDCTEQQNSDLCSKEQVQGFPTLYLYYNGKNIGEYRGDKSLESLVSFVNDHLIHDEL